MQRQLIKNLINDIRNQTTKSNALDVAENINNSTLNADDDGIARGGNGYLTIEPRGKDCHLALKVNDDILYTISATDKGLKIGILDRRTGGSKLIATFNAERGFVLEDDFQEQFMEDLTRRVIKQLNENNKDPLQIGRKLQLKKGIECQDAEIKGISTSGFKGFKEDSIKANGEPDEIIEIHKDSYGAYKIRAWLVIHSSENQVSLESTVYFFPDGTVEPKNSPLEEKLFKFLGMRTPPNPSQDQELKAQIVKSKKNSVSLQLSVARNGDKNVLKLRSSKQAITSDNILADIYYSIERLWEGPGWIDTIKQSPGNNE